MKSSQKTVLSQKKQDKSLLCFLQIDEPSYLSDKGLLEATRFEGRILQIK